MVTAAINIPHQQIAGLCQRYGIAELSLFGSVLRNDFDPARSDVDLLVEFLPEQRIGFFKLAEIEEEFSKLLGGRRIDLVSKNSINRWIRKQVLQEAMPIYVAS
ncbi:MAG: nucleotidyltransferase family protein [Tepidisphaeraceae bacterium]